MGRAIHYALALWINIGDSDHALRAHSGLAFRLVIHTSSAMTASTSWFLCQLQRACVPFTTLSCPKPKLDSRFADHAGWVLFQLQSNAHHLTRWESMLFLGWTWTLRLHFAIGNRKITNGVSWRLTLWQALLGYRRLLWWYGQCRIHPTSFCTPEAVKMSIIRSD